MKQYAFGLVAALVSIHALATPCEEVKAQIAAKLEAKHVTNYTLDVVASDKTGDSKIVGACEGGAKKVVYSRSATPVAKN